jgi:serine/threonine-protein kinase
MADALQSGDDSGSVHTIMGIPVAKPGSAFVIPPRRRPRNLEGTELLARYEVESVIGEGGMATIYRGRHKAIHKAVAIKVLDAALDHVPDAVERFLQEAQVTSQIVHENVVEVNDFGITADGVVFCVMELLVGETLADLVAATGPLPVARAAAIMRQVCSAVHAAHERGIIHRDLKPANCFRTPRTSNSDFIKVLDFGIARIARDAQDEDEQRARPRRTRVGCIVGTPDYMAPEQARAEKLDHRVDVYAAGGMLFELLTGRPPYVRGSAAELLAAHMHAPVPDPSTVVATLPTEICDVVRKAMAKQPADRHASMADLAADIADALLASGSIQASARSRRKRMLAMVGGSALLLGGWAMTPSSSSPPAAGVLPSLAHVEPPSSSPPPIAPPIAVPTVAPAAARLDLPSSSVPPPPPPAVEVSLARGDAQPHKRRSRKSNEVTSVAPAASVAASPTHDSSIRAKISEVKNPFADVAAPDTAQARGQ